MRSMLLRPLALLTVFLVAGVAGANPVGPVRCGWEDGGTVLGMSGTGSPPIIATSATAPEPVFTGNYSLRLENNSPTGSPKVYVAAIWDLDSDGQVVTVSFMRYYDPLVAMPLCRLWGRWNDELPGNLEANNGDASGVFDFGGGGGWEEVSYTWTVEDGHRGLVVELYLDFSEGGTVWIDDLDVLVMNPVGDITVQTPCFTVVATEQESWGAVKSLFR